MNELAQKLVDIARKKKVTIAVAESVTGGMIAAKITDIPRASEVFLCGIVAYDENAKIHSLGVDIDEVRKTHGYSEKTAFQMAERVRKRNDVDISISTTGCAGPDFVEGFEGGRVLFGLSQRGKETLIFDERFGNDRSEVRKKATEFALQKLVDALQ